MGRVIDESIKGALVDELLFGRLEDGGSVEVDIDTEKDELKFVFTAHEVDEPVQAHELN
jgi:ATP-dependent Clp protease ATP-binding subunit ClpA